MGLRIGDISLYPVSDGTFVARPGYFGAGVPPGSHPEFFSRHGAAWLSIGCFLIRASGRLILVDAGLGPDLQQLPHGMHWQAGSYPPACARSAWPPPTSPTLYAVISTLTTSDGSSISRPGRCSPGPPSGSATMTGITS